jgi:hypothetical protein
MRLLRVQKEKIVFSLSQVEQRIFLEILRLYPLVPASHQTLSKTLKGRQGVEAQHMLDEALAEQRAKHKAQFHDWLKAKGCFRRTKAGCNLHVRHADAEWLLQILNDIRIGSWLLLGSPDDRVEPEEIDPEFHRIWAAMEVSGMFQMALLHAMERQPPA